MAEQATVVVKSGGAFWKGCLGAMFGVALFFALIMGGCVLFVGSCATRMALNEQEGRNYLQCCAVGRITKWQENEYGSYETVEGSLKNDGTRTIRYWKASIQYLDAAGQVVESEMENSLTPIRPGDSQRFSAMHKKDPRVARVRVLLEEIQLEPK